MAASCQRCPNPTFAYTISDVEIAALFEGTGAPTLNGCRVICGGYGVFLIEHDGGGTPEAGFFDANALPPEPWTTQSCTLDGHQLTCVSVPSCDP